MATEKSKESFPFWEMMAAASRGAAEFSRSPEGQAALMKKKSDAAAELAECWRQNGVSDEQIAHLLVLHGFGGLA
jgi:hypothetical protein